MQMLVVEACCHIVGAPMHRYYEVTLIKQGNLHRSKLGWADPLFTCNGYECIGCGDDKHSWSWCPQPDDGIGKYTFSGHTGGLACHNGYRWRYGPKWYAAMLATVQPQRL